MIKKKNTMCALLKGQSSHTRLSQTIMDTDNPVIPWGSVDGFGIGSFDLLYWPISQKTDIFR